LVVSADVLALVASFLASEEVRAQQEWQTATSGREASGHKYSQYSPCGNFVLTHSGEETDDPDSSCVKLRHATSGRAQISFQGHTGFIHGCCFFPDGKAIVSASDDSTLKVWNAEWGGLLGGLVRTLEGHTDGVICVDVSHDSS
jgi:WD40 repeat protein